MSDHFANSFSPLQFGGIALGTAWSDYNPGADKEESFRLLDTFFEAGGCTVDTANTYNVR
jgi:aryl-alcohol dehydrogenase-like predicted oxidoreductase